MSAYKVDLSAAQNGASLNLSGRRIEITGASSPTAVATLVAVYADGYTRSPYVFKEQYKASSQMPFADLKITNAAQPGEWLEIEVTQSDSEWTYDPRDDIFIDSIASPVEIDSTTPIKVDDDATQTAIAALSTNLSDLLKNDDQKRNALTTLAGASYAEVSNGTTVVVAAGANLNGIVLRRGFITSSANISGVAASIKFGTQHLLALIGNSVTAGVFCQSLENIFLPAGTSLTITTAGTYATAGIWYEVL